MTCSCKLKANAVLRLDPTRTTVIRLAWERDLARRFGLIRKEIKRFVGQDDGLSLASPKALARPQKSDFEFTTSAGKVRGFNNWLKDEIDEKILEVKYSKEGRKIVGNKNWQSKYIDSAFKRGLRRGATEVMRASPYLYNQKTGVRIRRPPMDIEASFLSPVHADKAGLIYTRAYTDLEGITAAMDSKISRTLAQGMSEGWGPMQMARQMEKEVDISIQRARVIARTESIRAHHVGTINMYREAGLEGVNVLAEWSTAGFEVCPDCADLQGRVFSLDQIEPLIPLHPNCRCTAIPAGVGEDSASRGEFDEDTIGEQYKRKDGGFKLRGYFYLRGGTKKPSREVPDTGDEE